MLHRDCVGGVVLRAVTRHPDRECACVVSCLPLQCRALCVCSFCIRETLLYVFCTAEEKGEVDCVHIPCLCLPVALSRASPRDHSPLYHIVRPTSRVCVSVSSSSCTCVDLPLCAVLRASIAVDVHPQNPICTHMYVRHSQFIPLNPHPSTALPTGHRKR